MGMYSRAEQNTRVLLSYFVVESTTNLTLNRRSEGSLIARTDFYREHHLRKMFTGG